MRLVHKILRNFAWTCTIRQSSSPCSDRLRILNKWYSVRRTWRTTTSNVSQTWLLFLGVKPWTSSSCFSQRTSARKWIGKRQTLNHTRFPMTQTNSAESSEAMHGNVPWQSKETRRRSVVLFRSSAKEGLLLSASLPWLLLSELQRVSNALFNACAKKDGNQPWLSSPTADHNSSGIWSSEFNTASASGSVEIWEAAVNSGSLENTNNFIHIFSLW